jgi:hypothetical protein
MAAAEVTIRMGEEFSWGTARLSNPAAFHQCITNPPSTLRV